MMRLRSASSSALRSWAVFIVRTIALVIEMRLRMRSKCGCSAIGSHSKVRMWPGMSCARGRVEIAYRKVAQQPTVDNPMRASVVRSFRDLYRHEEIRNADAYSDGECHLGVIGFYPEPRHILRQDH